jgi:hypothetical protein
MYVCHVIILLKGAHEIKAKQYICAEKGEILILIAKSQEGPTA